MEKNELMDMQHGYVMDMFTDRVNKRSQTMKYISHDSISTKSMLLLLLSRFSCVRLCDPIDGSHQAPVPGSLQARTLEWVAVSFSNKKYKNKQN